MKYLIFDAGPIISLTMNGLLPILEKLKKEFKGEFIITPEVKREVIDKPLKIKKYALEGVNVQNLVDKKILTLSSKIIPNNTLSKQANKIMSDSNNLFTSGREKIRLIHKGEAECLAFSKLCNSENLIVVDERTTRLLTEAPENVKSLLERKLNITLKVNHKNLEQFKNFRFIRSSELLFLAYKKDLFELKKSPILLDALLYGVKFKGTSISSKEIEEMKKLA